MSTWRREVLDSHSISRGPTCGPDWTKAVLTVAGGVGRSVMFLVSGQCATETWICDDAGGDHATWIEFVGDANDLYSDPWSVDCVFGAFGQLRSPTTPTSLNWMNSTRNGGAGTSFDAGCGFGIS
jgi:hypothetical protein